MKFRFTSHAQGRYDERGISTDNIMRVVRSPDSSWSAQNGCIKSSKNLDGKILEVIYKKDGNVSIIITAYYL